VVDVELSIPAQSAYVGVVRLAIGALARAAELDEDIVDDLRIAVSEACTNSVLSHERSGVDAPVTVTWNEEPSRLLVEIVDEGAVYDADGLDADDTQAELRLSMSVAMLRSLMDGCEIAPREGPGMATRFTVPRRTR